MVRGLRRRPERLVFPFCPNLTRFRGRVNMLFQGLYLYVSNESVGFQARYDRGAVRDKNASVSIKGSEAPSSEPGGVTDGQQMQRERQIGFISVMQNTAMWRRGETRYGHRVPGRETSQKSATKETV